MDFDTIKLYARNYNFLRIERSIHYGTKKDFIKDDMGRCLKDGIISEEISRNSFWNEHNIGIQSCESIELENPWSLTYTFENDDSKPKNMHVWNIEFKQIILPEGWSLQKGCGCGRNMRPDSFRVFDQDQKCLVMLTYFLDYDI